MATTKVLLKATSTDIAKEATTQEKQASTQHTTKWKQIQVKSVHCGLFKPPKVYDLKKTARHG